ncbi:MAG: UDP-N-acetylmuramate dehydrogenase [Clostridiales bacterium]|nr:UDP-N-acetylmuramate dehydrogenase [Clostridiales bacterium]
MVFFPESTEQLTRLIGVLKNTAVRFAVLGAGTNTLVSDGGYDGIVVCLRHYGRIELRGGNEDGNRRITLRNNDGNERENGRTEPQNKYGNGNKRGHVELYGGNGNDSERAELRGAELQNYDRRVLVAAESGASMPRLAAFARERSIGGFEFLSGIPGSVGGGVYMNAGAFGGEIGDILVYAEVLEIASGKIFTLGRDDLKLSYRYSLFQTPENKSKYVILRSFFEAKTRERAAIERAIGEYAKRRAESQPAEPSLGSVFRRIGKVIPAVLIDKAGLKGYNIGSACVSEKHAGFIVNCGNASSSDFIALKEKIKETVFEKYGVRLKDEIEILE